MAETKQTNTSVRYFKDFRLSNHSTGIGFILLFILAAIVGWPNFLQIRNLLNILRQISYTGIIALGMTLVIISGGIDLSVGSMAAFTGGITIFFLNLISRGFPVGGASFGAFCHRFWGLLRLV